MKDNYAFKQRLTCILPNTDSAWCNLNYEPLLLFGFKSVLRTGDSEGERKLVRKECGGRGESEVAQTSACSPQYSSFVEATPTDFSTLLKRREPFFLEVAFGVTWVLFGWLF